MTSRRLTILCLWLLPMTQACAAVGAVRLGPAPEPRASVVQEPASRSTELPKLQQRPPSGAERGATQPFDQRTAAPRGNPSNLGAAASIAAIVLIVGFMALLLLHGLTLTT